jgi:hypothetical protein
MSCKLDSWLLYDKEYFDCEECNEFIKASNWESVIYCYDCQYLHIYEKYDEEDEDNIEEIKFNDEIKKVCECEHK